MWVQRDSNTSGSALDHHPQPAVHGMDRAHELAVRIEGQLGGAGHLRLQLVFIQSLFAGDIHKGSLGGVTGGLNGAVFLIGQGGIIAQCADGECFLPMLIPWDHTSTTVILFMVRVPVLSEQITPAQPGVSTAGQLFYNGIVLHHPLYAQSQHDGDNGGQALWDGGHRQGTRRT